MSIKETVTNVVEAMRLSDVEQLETLITEDFSRWIAEKQEYLQTAGEHNKAYFLGYFASGGEMFPNGADFTVTGMVSKSDKVAADAHMTADTTMGTTYDNMYHFLFKVADGWIKRMKEYLDTYHAKVTFGL